MNLSETISRLFGASQKNAGDSTEAGRPQKDQHMFNMKNAAQTNKPEVTSGLFSSADVAEKRRAEAWLQDRLTRGKTEVVTEIVVLSPPLAELLMARNPDNRNLRSRSIAAYASDIRDGAWQLNGESLKVSKDGYLNDGQHRCAAVIEAGRSIKTLITFGVDRATRLTVDQGATRTSGNYLAMQGVENSNLAAAIANLIWQYERSGGQLNDAGKYGATKAQIAATFKRHADDIVESVHAIPSSGQRFGSQSVLAFCHWLIARKSPVNATHFITRLCLGDGLSVKDPIYHCRERLLSASRLKAAEKAEIILRTWNASRAGKRASKSYPVLGELPQVEA